VLEGDSRLPVECDIKLGLCNIKGVLEQFAPGYFCSGQFTTSILARLGGVLFDPLFLTKLDGSSTAKNSLLFSCGTIYDMSVFPTEANPDVTPVRCCKAEDMLSLHCGYPFPFDELNELQEEHGEALDHLLYRVEQQEVDDPNRLTYCPELTDDLNQLVEHPSFALVKALHNSFTSPNPEIGESVGGWPVYMFRCGKIIVEGLRVRHEMFLADRGVDGGNGKGFLWYAMKMVFQHYCKEISISMLKTDPPTAQSSNTELWQLRHKRFTCVPESERGIVIKSLWLKNLGDPSTVYIGRDLYMRGVQFTIPSLFAICGNDCLQMSTLDGGIKSRICAIDWPISHPRQGAPEGDFQRKRDSRLKDESFYTPSVKAGFLFWIFAVNDQFYDPGGKGSRFKPRNIVKETDNVIAGDHVYIVDELLETMSDVSAKEATTKIAFLKCLREMIAEAEGMTACQVKQRVVEQAAAFRVVFKTSGSSTFKTQRKSTRSFIRLL
jgi:hypothetical protein